MYWKYEIWYYLKSEDKDLHYSGVIYAHNFMDANSKIIKMYVNNSVEVEKIILDFCADEPCCELEEKE